MSLFDRAQLLAIDSGLRSYGQPARCAVCGGPIGLSGRRRPLWRHYDPGAGDHAVRTLPLAFDPADLHGAAIEAKRLLLSMERRPDRPYAPLVAKIETTLEHLREASTAIIGTEDGFRTENVQVFCNQFSEAGATPADGGYTRTEWRDVRANEWSAIQTQLEVFLIPEVERVLAGIDEMPVPD